MTNRYTVYLKNGVEKMICCVLGHREICETEELREQLSRVIEELITCERVDTFLFGSKSRFNRLCYELVTQKQQEFPYIKRIYVRAEFPVISEDYRRYLLEIYEETYYPEDLTGAGRTVYIKRNTEMIDRSHFCLFYYDPAYRPKGRKSGTKIGLDYAVKRKKRIFIFPVPEGDEGSPSYFAGDSSLCSE